MLSTKEQSLLDALEPTAAEEGLEIVTVEVVGARKAPTIRVYIDTPEGVSFDELAGAQKWIGEMMDEIDPFPGAYTLEVSSPGIDRPLRTVQHFLDAVGETIQVVCISPVEGRSKWTGTLKGVEGKTIAMDVDDESYSIDLGNVKKAHIKGVIDFNG